MSTIENNTLIAEFMGGYQYDKEDNFVTFDLTDNMFSHDTILLKNLKFHSDWNWLMEVVDKISNIKHWCLNATIDWLSESQNRDGIYTIQDMYESVVEFIKEYNKQSK